MPKKETKVLKSLRLKLSLIEKLNKIAEDDNRTFTNLVESILMNEVKKKLNNL